MKLTGLGTKSFRVAGLGLAFAVLTGSVWAQDHYNVFDLGVLGNPPAAPYIISNDSLVSGAAATPDGEMHAVLWFKGQKFDIGTPGLGGPNSAAFSVNVFGQSVGQAETSAANAEDFCGFNAYGFPSSTACRPFLWQDGVMRKLSTLGGDNGYANSINNLGLIAGIAETDATDPTSGCPVNQFEAVVWENGKIHPLPPHHGDSDGVAAQVNNKGQVVGASGTCGSFNPNTGLYLVENHAVLWENGTVTDLGNLGGNGGPAGNAGNHACAINNRGQVVGHSELGDSLASPFHAFLWTREMGRMLDLGSLPGPFGVTPAGQNDFASLALGINDRGEVVGASLDANFDSRAFLWENGVMTDLNTLIAANPSGLYLLEAVSINSRGEITGVALANGETHGFLAIPDPDRRSR